VHSPLIPAKRPVPATKCNSPSPDVPGAKSPVFFSFKDKVQYVARFKCCGTIGFQFKSRSSLFRKTGELNRSTGAFGEWFATAMDECDGTGSSPRGHR